MGLSLWSFQFSLKCGLSFPCLIGLKSMKMWWIRYSTMLILQEAALPFSGDSQSTQKTIPPLFLHLQRPHLTKMGSPVLGGRNLQKTRSLLCCNFSGDGAQLPHALSQPFNSTSPHTRPEQFASPSFDAPLSRNIAVVDFDAPRSATSLEATQLPVVSSYFIPDKLRLLLLPIVTARRSSRRTAGSVKATHSFPSSPHGTSPLSPHANPSPPYLICLPRRGLVFSIHAPSYLRSISSRPPPPTLPRR